MKRYVLIFAGLVIASYSFGRVTGTIQGRVTDKATGEPLPFVNVLIEGTMMGAATNIEGEYFIINVPVGTYTLSTRMMGYVELRVENVRVSAGITTKIDIPLEPTIIEREAILVTAERPIVQTDVTSSMTRVEGDEMERMPVSNFHDIVAAQAGAVETEGALSGGLHIRGGRSGEVAFYVDGISVNNPATRLAGVNIANMAIQEMLIKTGGFNAEFGQALSGIVNIVTREGGRTFESDIEFATDGILGRGYDFGFNNLNLSAGGPVPFIRDLTYFVSGEGFHDDTHLPNNSTQRIGGTAKLSWRPSADLRAVLSSNFSAEQSYRYWHSFSSGDWAREKPARHRGNTQINLQLTHTLSPRTFYTVNIGGFNTHFRMSSQDGRHYSEFSAIGRRLPWVSHAVREGWYDPEGRVWADGWSEERAWMYFYENERGWGERDPGTGEWLWTTDNLEHRIEALNDRAYTVNQWMLCEEGDSIYYHQFCLDTYLVGVRKMLDPATYFDADSLRDFMPSGNMHFFRYNRDEFRRFNQHFRPWWHEHSTTNYSLDASITSQVNQYNQVKAGGFFKIHDLSFTDVQFVNPNPYTDSYNKEPLTAAAYIQNKLEFEDLTINAGVRFDYFDPRSKFYVDLEDLDAGREEASAKTQFSPRFGISFAVTDRTKLFANYGHFFQPLALRDIYMNLEADVTSGLPLLGNPDLPPEKTIAYELGLGHALTDNLGAEISLYHKHMPYLLSTGPVSTIWRRSLVTYTIHKLGDFATVSGVDVSLTKRGEFLSGSIAYSYLNAQGTGSAGREFYHRYLGRGVPRPMRAYPLEFDVTHSLKVGLNLYIPPAPAGIPLWARLFSDLNTNLQFRVASGAPFTPTDLKGTPLEVGSRRLPATSTLDMRMDRGFNFGGLRYTLFLDVRNLLNRENVVRVHKATGRPDDDGRAPKWDPVLYEARLDGDPYLQRKYGDNPYDLFLADLANWKAFSRNPANFGDPRLVRVGIRFGF